MATTVNLRGTKTIPSAYPQVAYQDLSIVNTAATSLILNADMTIAAPDERPFIMSATPMAFWSEQVADASVTISGSISFTMKISAVGTTGFTAMARFRARLYKVTAGGSNVETFIAQADDTADIPLTTLTARTFTVTPATPVTVVRGERFILRLSMFPTGAGGTDYGTATQYQLQYASASTSSVTFTETIAFRSNTVVLRPRRTNTIGIGNFLDLSDTQGTSVNTTAVVNTVASGTLIQWTRTAGGTLLEFLSARLKRGWPVVAASVFTFRTYALESNASANCAIRLKVFQRKPDGAETLVYDLTATSQELGTTVTTYTSGSNYTQNSFTVSNFAEDDRIVLRYYAVPFGALTMGGGFTCTLNYDHNTPTVTNDTQLIVNDSPEFKLETDPAGTSTVPGGMTTLGLGN